VPSSKKAASARAKAPPARDEPRPPRTDRVFDKAREHFRDGDYGGALAIVNQILNRDPGNLDALALASGCQSLQGHYDRAVDFDRRAVEADPKSPQAWMTLALDLSNLGDAEGAEEAYRRAAEIDPTRAAAWWHLACLAARRGDADEALADLEKAAAARPEYREEAKSQPEFAPLLEDPRFVAIVSGGKESDDPYAEWMRSGT